MELLIFGHAGAPVLVFPTSMGRFYEFEDNGMIWELRERLDNGHLQLYCLDSVDAESWYNWNAHPRWRIERHLQYDGYISEEVLPLIGSKNPNNFLITTGASFGAYQAINYAFRHSEIVRKVVAMSGRYNMHGYLNDYWDNDVYFNSPIDFIGGVDGGSQEFADRLRRMEIYLTLGEYDLEVCRNETHQLSDLLWMKGISNRVDVWNGVHHDWPLWKWQITNYL